MITLVLQTVVSLLLAAFGVMALAIARRARAGSGAAAWRLTGATFLIYAADKLLQEALGAAAFLLGPEHPVYGAYLQVAPAANHSRTFLVFAFYAALAALPFAARLGRAASAPAFGLLAATALAAGGAYGVVEGRLDESVHYTTTAVIDTGGFIVLASVLYLLLVRDTVDRWLWFSVAAYGFTSIVGALYLMALSWVATAGAYTPPVWHLQAIRVAFAAAMVWLAAQRLSLAIRGRPASGLLGGTERYRPTLAG